MIATKLDKIYNLYRNENYDEDIFPNRIIS